MGSDNCGDLPSRAAVQRLGNCRERRLGGGENGEVWRADTSGGRTGAIKILCPRRGREGEYRLARFRDEIGFLIEHSWRVRVVRWSLRASSQSSTLSAVSSLSLHAPMNGMRLDSASLLSVISKPARAHQREICPEAIENCRDLIRRSDRSPDLRFCGFAGPKAVRPTRKSGGSFSFLRALLYGGGRPRPRARSSRCGPARRP